MRYFISAGEASGDLHAAQVIAALKAVDPSAEFTFLGGDLMAAEAGCEPVIHYRHMAYMGFSEVLRHLREIFGNLSTARRAMRDAHPDAVILVDYPGFNLKLAKTAHELGIPVYYYISPKVWVWKEWRVKDIRRYVRRMLCILPFEPKFYAGHHMDALYVGNPSVEEVDKQLAAAESAEEFRRRHGLPADRPILALVPGSRRGEIRNNLPIMDAVARRHPDMLPIVAMAPGIEPEFYRQYFDFQGIENATFELMHHATAALVTSGTATLECALAGTPQVVCYRANGSKLSYNIMRLILKGKYVSLPNLIADDEVIPEMLVHLCTVDSVDQRLTEILPGHPGRQKQLDGYARMRAALGASDAARTTAEAIFNDIRIHR